MPVTAADALLQTCFGRPRFVGLDKRNWLGNRSCVTEGWGGGLVVLFFYNFIRNGRDTLAAPLWLGFFVGTGRRGIGHWFGFA